MHFKHAHQSISSLLDVIFVLYLILEQSHNQSSDEESAEAAEQLPQCRSKQAPVLSSSGGWCFLISMLVCDSGVKSILIYLNEQYQTIKSKFCI